MKSILTATLAASLFLGISVPSEVQAQPDPGRWCTVLSSVDPNRNAAAQSVDCDGSMGASGSLHNFAQVRRMSVVVFNPKGKPERLDIADPGLYAQDIANTNFRREEAVREVVNRALKKQGKPELGERLINVDAIQISSREKVYRDYDGRQPIELDKLAAPANIVALDAQPLAGEMKCLAKMQEVPHMDAGLVLSPGDAKHEPILLLQAQTIGQYRSDVVFTPNGFYVNPYRDGGRFSNARGEHYVKIPGAGDKEPQYYYHSWTPRSSQQPFVQSTPLANARVALQTIDPTSLTRDPGHQAMKELHKKMLLGTRNFRRDFDSGNPRFRSPVVLAQVRAAIETCRNVPGMQPELGFFENYIFRNQPLTQQPLRRGVGRPDTLPPLRQGTKMAGGKFSY